MRRQRFAWPAGAAVGLALTYGLTRVLGQGVVYWLALVALGAYLTLTVVFLRRSDR